MKKASPAPQIRSDARRVAIVTLGCDKNTVDNEYLAGMLERAGWEVVTASDGRPFEAAVVTTCGFIAAAKEQSVQTIVDLAARKRAGGSPRRIFVAGCLSQRYGEELMEQIPEIDGLVGVGQFAQLTEMVASNNGAGGRRMQIAPEPSVDIDRRLARKPLGDAVHAFLKIADGCNHACSFCSIPAMKGKLRSVEPEILIAEAEGLLARGVKEIDLVAQDLSDYGRDRWRDYRLPELIKDLCAIEGDFWVRCLYFYPGNVTDRFLEVMASEEKVVPYLEMPLQHLDPGVLRAMRRPFHEVNTFDVVKRIREVVPGIALRTTFIVGFPGETRRSFQNLLNGIEKLEFERMGAFEYSREEGTPSAEMGKQVPAKTKSLRWRKVMERQAKISERVQKRRVGRTEKVLIERFDEQSGYWVGRSAMDAPEVDGCVYVEGDLKRGDFVDVHVVESSAYDVHGTTRGDGEPRSHDEHEVESIHAKRS